jgi:HAD superfamily hydrolase (TIGR01509 family)
MAIRAVLFDLGNTLVQYDYDFPAGPFRKILTALGIHRSLQDTLNAFTRAQDDANHLNLRASLGKIPCEEYWRTWDSLVLKHLGIEDPHDLAALIHSKWLDFVDCQPYPDARDVLSTLKARAIKIGLISTGYEAEIAQILQKAHIPATVFDVIVGVDTVHASKPSPDVFRHALSQLHVAPEQALFIGDHVELDYHGATAAGLHALLIHRDTTQPNHPHDVEPIRSLHDVFRFID